MKFIICLYLSLLISPVFTAQARDVQAELQSIQKQKQLVRKAQQQLNQELGQVGENLKKLDLALLEARKSYRTIRKEIQAVDTRLKALTKKKHKLQESMRSLFEQMLKEAKAAYQHGRAPSIWVDILSKTSITELPHRQYLLKHALLSQEKDRKVWRLKVEALNLVELEEQKNKNSLLALQDERKNTEQRLVARIKDKRNAAQDLQSNIKKKEAQEKRLARQEEALKRLLDGLEDTLLESDKKSSFISVRKQKGKLPWPIHGRIIVGFGQKTSSGIKLSGVHLSPQKRSEKGKLVKAFGQGQVRYADWFGGYGLMMIVDYGHGIMAVYAHNDALHKELGDWVEKGEVLAEAGSTGWIDDVRLYFEIRERGKPVNPTRWCKK